MNKRIQELYKEATGKDWAYDFDTQIAERFAQLIVRECASIVDIQGRWILYDKLAVKIKKHFGVEE